ncbi:hypothetical protein ACHHV8_36580 [Paenibacillus sp. TAB 01]|uniref:hypothetical protein n=1 Tax=Paenibacillus sp. TAB 01 TaxID=3368988 RepID=UPI003751C359
MMEDLFPEATATEVKLAKAYLKKYVEKKQLAEFFNSNPPKTDKNKRRQEEALKLVSFIERAVDQIRDGNVKAVVEYRYIKGNSRAATILKYSGWDYCDKTIDRKLEEGAVSVANTLLYLE